MNVAYPEMFCTWTKRDTSDPFLAEVTDFINRMNTLISFHINQPLARPGATLTLNQQPPRGGAAASDSDSQLTKSCLKARPVKYEVMSEDRERKSKIRFKGSEVKLFQWDPDERGSGEKRNFTQLTNVREDRNFKQMRKRMMREAKQELRLRLHYCNNHARSK